MLAQKTVAPRPGRNAMTIIGTLCVGVMDYELGGDKSQGQLHLHHWWLAWLPSLLFSFNHPISAMSLAVSLAIFVQGCAAYNIAPLVYDSSCQHYYSNGTIPEKLSCIVDSPADFDVCTRHGNVFCF